MVFVTAEIGTNHMGSLYSSDKVEILTKEKLIEIIIKEGLLITNE